MLDNINLIEIIILYNETFITPDASRSRIMALLNNLEIFEEARISQIPERWSLRLSLLDFAFQPIANINTGVVFGYEALLRNYQPAGFSCIGEIFDRAFEDNLLFTIDLYLREKAIQKFCQIPWHNSVKLFFNIDNRLWHSPDFDRENALGHLHRQRFNPDAFCIELSEKHLLDYDSHLCQELKHMKKNGCKVAVDDCGSGFSGLKMMYYSEPEFVKIDRFFIMDISRNPRKRLFVSSIVNISHMIGSIVIAEGVETKEEFYICREIGCDLVQGFYLDRPQQRLTSLKPCYEHILDTSLTDRRFKDSDDKHYIQTQMIYIEPVRDVAKIVDVFEKFKNIEGHPFYPVVNEANEPLGLITEKRLKPYAFSRFGSELLRNRRYANRLLEFITKCPIADIKTPVEKILELFSQDFDSVEGIIIVENLQYAGFLDTKSLLKALNEKNIAYARDQNPLTKLPGNTLIYQYLSEAILHTDRQFIFTYFDFNHFKPYNDKFGFRNGDRVILLFAEILKKRQTKPEIFVGHVGGDDFFLGIRDCDRENALSLIRNIMETFDRDVQSFYGQEELRNGYIIAMDRDDQEKVFPLLTVSAAVIVFPIDRARRISNSEVGEIIAQEKQKAKKRSDKLSIVTID